MKLWVCGKYRGQDANDNSAWEFQGVFDTEDAAIAACVEPCDFIGPVLLNELLTQESISWPDCRYPLAGVLGA